jgi:hypothetical protein
MISFLANVKQTQCLNVLFRRQIIHITLCMLPSIQIQMLFLNIMQPKKKLLFHISKIVVINQCAAAH